MPSSSAVGLVGSDLPCCLQKLEKGFWFWSSTAGPEDAATRSLRRALNLMLVRSVTRVTLLFPKIKIYVIFLRGEKI